MATLVIVIVAVAVVVVVAIRRSHACDAIFSYNVLPTKREYFSECAHVNQCHNAHTPYVNIMHARHMSISRGCWNFSGGAYIVDREQY